MKKDKNGKVLDGVIPRWTFEFSKYGFSKCLFCDNMERFSTNKRVYLKELDTYPCLIYPSGIPKEILVNSVYPGEDCDINPVCEKYKLHRFNKEEQLIKYFKSCKELPPWEEELRKEYRKQGKL